jgi:hypothetical protein
MRPDFIVDRALLFQFVAGIAQVEEQIYVQAFVPQLASEGLNMPVVGGLARPHELELNPVPVGPTVQGFAVEL